MLRSDYEIVIGGELPPAFADQFAPLRVNAREGRTTLSAHDVDQPGLHGILNRVADLGLTLLEVRTVPALAAEKSPTGG